MRRRIVRAIVAVAAATLVLFGVPLAVAVKRVYRDQEVTRLEREATAATAAIGARVSRADPAELPRPRHARLALYDRSAVRVTGAGPPRADRAVTRALAGAVAEASGKGALVVAVPVARGETVIGAVRAERGDGVVTARARDAWLVMALIAVGVLALAAGLAAVISRRLARPVEELTRAARRLGEGDFVTAAPASGIAELGAAAAALNTTARRLGDLVDRERAFSVDASHQLRTPITALRLDLESGRPEAALAHVDRLESTVETLLAAARDERPPAQEIAVAAVIGELENEWRGRLAAAGRPLRVVVDAHLPSATVSAGAAEQILQVLMENALEHGRGAVRLHARAAAGAVAIDVADEGPGVTGDPEAVFARRGASAAPGHGVGLSLARSMATADGGRLILQRSGPRPTFTLLLPVSEP